MDVCLQCDGCLKPCHDELQDCYVLDSNGYVMLSEQDNDTGLYFGELDGTGAIMESMIELGIYRQLSIYDFQAHCGTRVQKPNDADAMMTVGGGDYYCFCFLLQSRCVV